LDENSPPLKSFSDSKYTFHISPCFTWVRKHYKKQPLPQGLFFVFFFTSEVQQSMHQS